MGAWEEQAKRTNQQGKLWSEAQEFSFIEALQSATNEEEVKAAYIREFSLPVKTQERHDLVVNKVLFEFKYSVKLGDIEVAAKVIAQAIYYINRLFKKGRINEAEYLVIADKDEARFFKVAEFQLFYESCEYQWDNFRPSSPDPKLIEAVKNSKILESNRIYKLTSQDELHLFSSRLYKVLSPSNFIPKSTEKSRKADNFSKSKFMIVGFIFIVMLSLGIVLGSQHYFTHLNKSIPTHKD
ncbi:MULTISPECIES: hypothetical protein [Kamptonema]|uniref:hypothetical protein n=1 Tax=Kamptonema TaxID=1501433 RepID=UPI0001DAC562|nr:MULTISPECIES: hypothetical protein [Kamptonema]CBN56121.1 hypothetical protein OSCI_2780029 [Kamptonema sp. PCC 6506]